MNDNSRNCYEFKVKVPYDGLCSDKEYRVVAPGVSGDHHMITANAITAVCFIASNSITNAIIAPLEDNIGQLYKIVDLHMLITVEQVFEELKNTLNPMSIYTLAGPHTSRAKDRYYIVTNVVGMEPKSDEKSDEQYLMSYVDGRGWAKVCSEPTTNGINNIPAGDTAVTIYKQPLTKIVDGLASKQHTHAENVRRNPNTFNIEYVSCDMDTLQPINIDGALDMVDVSNCSTYAAIEVLQLLCNTVEPDSSRRGENTQNMFNNSHGGNNRHGGYNRHAPGCDINRGNFSTLHRHDFGSRMTEMYKHPEYPDSLETLFGKLPTAIANMAGRGLPNTRRRVAGILTNICGAPLWSVNPALKLKEVESSEKLYLFMLKMSDMYSDLPAEQSIVVVGNKPGPSTEDLKFLLKSVKHAFGDIKYLREGLKLLEDKVATHSSHKQEHQATIAKMKDSIGDDVSPAVRTHLTSGVDKLEDEYERNIREVNIHFKGVSRVVNMLENALDVVNKSLPNNDTH